MGECSRARARVQKQKQNKETEELLRDLGDLLCSVLECSSLLLDDVSEGKTGISPVGFTWLLFGVSSALILIGFMAFLIGVMMMPFAAMLAIFFSFLGILDTLSVAAIIPS